MKHIHTWGKAQRDYFASKDRAEFLELSCGHYVHRESPEAIAGAVARFLSTV